MNFFERLMGTPQQVVEQPIYNLPPLQPMQNPMLQPGRQLNYTPLAMPESTTNPNAEAQPSYLMPGVDISQGDYNNALSQELVDNPMMGTGLTATPAKESKLMQFARDLSGGFQENANNGFKLDNLMPVENKNKATKIGEGLGTVGRFMASPTGRGLLTAGLVGATGGSPTQALTYGLNTGVQNFNNVNQNRANRQLLDANGIDTSEMNGYIINDMAKNLSDNYNKLNNAQYRTDSLSIRTRDLLRKEGLTEAQIDKILAETDLVKEKTKTEPVKRDVMKNPPTRKFVSTRNGYTKVDINHNSNGKQSTTPKPTSGDYYF